MVAVTSDTDLDIIIFAGGWLGEPTLCLKAVVRYLTDKPDGTPVKRLDVTRLNELGWMAKTELRDGIERTYAWYVAQLPATAPAEDG